jgi:hypothetical protein
VRNLGIESPAFFMFLINQLESDHWPKKNAEGFRPSPSGS